MIPSFRSRIFVCFLKVINFKKRVEKRAVNRVAENKKRFPPGRIRRLYHINIQKSHKKDIVTFESKEKVNRNHILFLHGGAYIFNITRGHWRLSEKIVRKIFCRMTHMDYPLAPKHNYKDTFSMLSDAYELLLGHYPKDKFILMGDSAGGGLALAFAQKLVKEKHKRLPEKIVLLSPWLDLSLSDPDIRKLEISDHILSVKMLQAAGRQYADGDRLDQYLLSPIKGEFNSLPQTIIFYGTEEVFSADCKRLKSITATRRKNFIFREYQKMQHDWALFPLPESKQLMNEVCDFITGQKVRTAREKY